MDDYEEIEIQSPFFQLKKGEELSFFDSHFYPYEQNSRKQFFYI